jgi:HK97 gp10 family phage protein
MHIKGLADLQKFFDQLPAKVEANILRGALRAGIQPVQADAKMRVGHVSGLLRDGLKISTRRKGGIVYAVLRSTGKHGFIAHWIEYGTAPHLILSRLKNWLSFGGQFFRRIDHPGIKNPIPFMRPALDTQAQTAVIAAAEYMKKRLATKEGLDTAGIIIAGDE